MDWQWNSYFVLCTLHTVLHRNGTLHVALCMLHFVLCTFKVVKNTFARIAADEAGRSELKEIMNGPIGFVVTEGDPASAAKAFVKYSGDNDLPIKIIGGMLDSEVLTSDRVEALAKLPSKEELIAKKLGSMSSPITGLVMVMSGPVRALTTVLQRHVDNQQEGSVA